MKKATQFTLKFGFIVTVSAVAIDIIVPSLDHISKSLNISYANVQFALSLFLIIFAIFQLLTGLVTEKFGPQKTLLLSFSIFCLGSLCCSYANEFSQLIIGRSLQAMGAASGTIIVRGLARERFTGKDLRSVLANLSTLNALVPLSAPILGAWMNHQFGWRSVFWVMTFFGIIAIAVVCFAHLNGDFKKIASSKKTSVISIIRDHDFIKGVLILGLTFTALLSFISILPIVSLAWFGESAVHTGIILAFSVLFYSIGTQLSKYKGDSEKTVSQFSYLFLLGSFLFILSNFLIKNTLGLPLGIIGILTFNLGAGFCYPIGHITCLKNIHNNSTKSAALASFLQTLISAFLSQGFVRLGELFGSIILTVLISIFICCTLLSCLFLNRKINHKNTLWS